MPVVDLSCGCRHYSGPEKLDYKQDRLCRYHEGCEDGSADERAAIVAYGKKYADQPHPIEADTGMFSPECRGVILGFLDYISCGEHRKGGG